MSDATVELWECRYCNHNWMNGSTRRGEEVVCPLCKATEGAMASDGMSCLELLDGAPSADDGRKRWAGQLADINSVDQTVKKQWITGGWFDAVDSVLHNANRIVIAGCAAAIIHAVFARFDDAESFADAPIESWIGIGVTLILFNHIKKGRKK